MARTACTDRSFSTAVTMRVRKQAFDGLETNALTVLYKYQTLLYHVCPANSPDDIIVRAVHVSAVSA